MANAVAISAAVEGIVDEAVVRTLILFSGAIPGPVYGKPGKTFLQHRVPGYNAAARHAPWIIVIDLDSDHDCAPPLRASWLPDPAPHLCFRIAVRESSVVIGGCRANYSFPRNNTEQGSA
jgi:hypothetical protein